MRRFTFQADTEGLEVAGVRENVLKRRFQKWLEAEGLIVKSIDVIESAPRIPGR